MFAVYRASTRSDGKKSMTPISNSNAAAAPTSLDAVCKLGRVLTKRGEDILAFLPP